MSDSNPPQAANDDTETEIVGASPSSSSSATQADCADDPEIVELLKFDPAPRLVKRPDGWTAERQRCFIRLIVETGSPQRAAAAMGKKLSGLEQVYRSEGAEGFREAWDRAVAMSDPKIWSFYGFGAAVFWSYEDCFLQFQAKTLDEYSWASDVATLERLVAYPPYRAVWKMARDGMGGDYRDYVDSLMDKVPSDTSRSLTDVFKIYIAEELPSAEARESA